MATEKPRFTITMDESLLSEVDNFKFEHRIKNQSKAIVELVRMGMDALAAQDAEKVANIKKASEAELPAPKPPSPVVPMPHPYVGVLLRPQDFIAAAISLSLIHI